MQTAYIETRIPSYYAGRLSYSLLQAAKQKLTREWWDGGCSNLEIFTSLETLDEISEGDPVVAAARVKLMEGVPVLEISGQVRSLTHSLLTKNLVPMKASSDAVHIAVAAVHGLDFLVTWNIKHIANPFIREKLQKEVIASGFQLPMICTPEELFYEID